MQEGNSELSPGERPGEGWEMKVSPQGGGQGGRGGGRSHVTESRTPGGLRAAADHRLRDGTVSSGGLAVGRGEQRGRREAHGRGGDSRRRAGDSGGTCLHIGQSNAGSWTEGRSARG